MTPGNYELISKSRYSMVQGVNGEHQEHRYREYHKEHLLNIGNRCSSGPDLPAATRMRIPKTRKSIYLRSTLQNKYSEGNDLPKVRSPRSLQQSSADPTVHLFYRRMELLHNGTHCQSLRDSSSLANSSKKIECLLPTTSYAGRRVSVSARRGDPAWDIH